MSINVPAIVFDESVDGEFTITAYNRVSNAAVAAVMSYDADDAIYRIELQLIELGFDVYAPEIY